MQQARALHLLRVLPPAQRLLLLLLLLRPPLPGGLLPATHVLPLLLLLGSCVGSRHASHAGCGRTGHLAVVRRVPGQQPHVGSGLGVNSYEFRQAQRRAEGGLEQCTA